MDCWYRNLLWFVMDELVFWQIVAIAIVALLQGALYAIGGIFS